MVLGSWLLAAFEFLQPVEDFLDSDAMSFSLGGARFSAFIILRALVLVLVVLWLANIVCDFGSKRIRSVQKINANTRSLVSKFFQVSVYFIAFLILLQSLGIDFTGLAIFSGAIGIGVGFGLQKITSNFISGLILLFEKSIEEGDLVELDAGLAGFVKTTGARYTLIETFEGREVMVPNEEFITSKVTNWTFSNNRGRIEIHIGVAYGSDLKKVQALLMEAATEHPRCSIDPPAECFLMNYGDSSIDFRLQFWVDNIIEGRLLPKSEVLFSIWDKFQVYGIQIPFPQRDVHLIEPKTKS